ncbi:hypothetical protein E5Q_05847 [Mixia osmundae IAM 14324]|uniref:Uncharacterized protein n=2 Tax=Mixia osmundae (strain CBS 9802 / IAM 14324 / JCM 22182 / KY 12970) TaxID=764103 RepID=G7E8J6_MIXOS|nr:hypothetical protein E5Q_05847 [Mixia osmundae IAM 14324]
MMQRTYDGIKKRPGRLLFPLRAWQINPRILPKLCSNS